MFRKPFSGCENIDLNLFNDIFTNLLPVNTFHLERYVLLQEK